MNPLCRTFEASPSTIVPRLVSNPRMTEDSDSPVLAANGPATCDLNTSVIPLTKTLDIGCSVPGAAPEQPRSIQAQHRIVSPGVCVDDSQMRPKETRLLFLRGGF